MASTKVEASVEIPTNTRIYDEKELTQLAKEYQKTTLGSFLPILEIERGRVALMVTSFSLIGFVYAALRVYKDKVIYSVLEPAAQNYLKLGTFPFSLLFVGVVNKLLNIYSIDTVFEYGSYAFAAILFVMAGLLYIAKYIQAEAVSVANFFVSETATVRGFKFFYMISAILNQWVFSLFYILCDVIGSIMIGYFFMTYINSHNTKDQNKRFVRVLYIFSNLSSMAGSKAIGKWNSWAKKQTYEMVYPYYAIFTAAAAVSFIIVALLKRRLDKSFEKNPIVIIGGSAASSGKKKKSVSFLDSLYYVIVSRLLRAMSFVSLCYNISAALINNLFSCSNKAYSVYINDKDLGVSRKSTEMAWSAFLTTFILIFPMNKVMDRVGIAVYSGCALLCCGFGLIVVTAFAYINYPLGGQENMVSLPESIMNYLPTSLATENIASTIIMISAKVSKYAFFDIAKEAISMRINADIRPLFKGVYDGLCGKLGKTLGSVYGIFMESVTNGNRDARYYAPVTFTIAIVSSIVWAYYVRYLSKSYAKAVKEDTYINPDYIPGSKLAV